MEHTIKTFINNLSKATKHEEKRKSWVETLIDGEYDTVEEPI
jgi:hypothetical protein